MPREYGKRRRYGAIQRHRDTESAVEIRREKNRI